MRGGMPSPPYVQAASVLVFPAPSRRSPSVWLSPLVVGLTVALAGAATGDSASQLRQTGGVNLGKRPALGRSVGASGGPGAGATPSPAPPPGRARRGSPGPGLGRPGGGASDHWYPKAPAPDRRRRWESPPVEDHVPHAGPGPH